MGIKSITLLMLPFIVIIISNLVACGGSADKPDIDPMFFRYTFISIWGNHDGVYSGGFAANLSGSAPFETACIASWQTSDADHAAGHWGWDSITKIEINHGDSSEWFDYMAVAPSWSNTGSASDIGEPGKAAHHTYTTPGDYTVRCRVTYWDGTVLESTSDGEGHVQVLP